MPCSPLSSVAFEGERRRLLGLAYRMTGSLVDAEDLLQEAWIRWSRVQEPVENPAAYLTRVVTRLCLDRLDLAATRREAYVGEWLPEPVGDVDALSAPQLTELSEDVSFALLLLLDRLSPPERAAFLLHDVFGAPFGEVATILGRTQESCRKLASRARAAVRRPSEPVSDPVGHRRLLEAFLGAAREGDLDRLETMLAEDAVALSDGGGRVRSALRPVTGRLKVARFIAGLARKAAHLDGLSVDLVQLNGSAAILLTTAGLPLQAILAEAAGGLIVSVYLVANPDKLRGVLSADARPIGSPSMM